LGQTPSKQAVVPGGDPALKTHYLLVDYENVQPKSLPVLNGHPFKVIVFLGENQTRVPVEFARALQGLGSSAEYIQIAGSGSNALDFHIAFTIGELASADKNAFFHIISKDSGFDPLIKYLHKKGISAQRSKTIMLPMPKMTVDSKDPLEQLNIVVSNLTARKSGRPRKVKTLSNAINTLFPQALRESEMEFLIKTLEENGHISIEGEDVSYHFSEMGKTSGV
jgi:PIN domain